MKNLILIISIGLSFPAGLLAQGSLNPPPGPPAPSLKTLQQIEPRVDVTTLAGDADYAHVINASGSYYLTGNIDVSTATHGIDIRASGVTLDLEGFTVRRTSGSGGNGVEISTGLDCVAVKNGSIEEFANGVLLESASLCRLGHLRIHAGTDGIKLEGNCKLNLILDCAVTGTSENGIELETDTGACNQNLIQRCTVSLTGTAGISFDGSGTGQLLGNAVLDSAISDAGTGGGAGVGHGIRFVGGNCLTYANLVCNNVISDVADSGVAVDVNSAFANGNLISDLTINDPGDDGLILRSPSGGSVDGNLVQRLTVSDPGITYVNLAVIQGGSVSGNVVRDCLGRDSGSVGINCDAGSTASSYAADFNRIEGNHLSRFLPLFPIGSFHAIRTTDSAGNFIFRNTAVDYFNGYSYSGLDTVGPTITASGVLNTTAPNAHPWANFSR